MRKVTKYSTNPVQNLRKKLEFEQAPFAADLQISLSSLQKIERGERGVSPRLWRRIKHRFGIDIDLCDQTPLRASDDKEYSKETFEEKMKFAKRSLVVFTGDEFAIALRKIFSASDRVNRLELTGEAMYSFLKSLVKTQGLAKRLTTDIKELASSGLNDQVRAAFLLCSLCDLQASDAGLRSPPEDIAASLAIMGRIENWEKSARDLERDIRALKAKYLDH